MKNQDILRQNCKIAKILNDDWNYQKMCEVIDITLPSFYNWLSGAYDLSDKKYRELSYVISNLLD